MAGIVGGELESSSLLKVGTRFPGPLSSAVPSLASFGQRPAHHYTEAFLPGTSMVWRDAGLLESPSVKNAVFSDCASKGFN